MKMNFAFKHILKRSSSASAEMSTCQDGAGLKASRDRNDPKSGLASPNLFLQDLEMFLPYSEFFNSDFSPEIFEKFTDLRQ